MVSILCSDGFQESQKDIPFFLLIFCWAYRYIPRMIRFVTTYSTRTAMRTCASSNGIFLDTCIIPRMMTKLVLHVKPNQYFVLFAARAESDLHLWVDHDEG